MLIFALSAAAFVMIGFAAAARMWSWVTSTSFLDAPVWSWAPGGAGALGAFAVAVSFLGTFWYFWRGASPAVLKEIHASRLDLATAPVVANVVEALSLGIGKPPPTLYVTDDPAPNALSLRSRRSRILVVTSGCAVLTRDELEALCAHELGHLWADDAHWVTSGMVALARARRFGGLILAIGIALLVVVGGIAHYADIFLWSAGLTAIALVVLGWVSKHSLRRLEFGVRRNADEIADVVAINLAKNPASLGAVCARLAANDRSSRSGRVAFGIDVVRGGRECRRRRGGLRRRPRRMYAATVNSSTARSMRTAPPGSALPPEVASDAGIMIDHRSHRSTGRLAAFLAMAVFAGALAILAAPPTPAPRPSTGRWTRPWPTWRSRHGRPRATSSSTSPATSPVCRPRGISSGRYDACSAGPWAISTANEILRTQT